MLVLSIGKENEMKGESQAKFGWFDFIDDQSVSAALLTAVEKWAEAKKCQTLEGPLGFSNLDKMGMLIEGFEYMPTITSLYNYPYYQQHTESCGYEKAADWVEYQLLTPQVIPDKVQRFAKLIGEKYKLRLIDIKSQGNVKKYARKIFDLFNETHEELHGFTVLNDKQVEGYINRYYRLARLDLITMVVDENDELVGYAVSFPTLSKAFQKMNGSLWPFGIYHLYKARKSNERVTMYLIGVAKKVPR